MPNHWESSKRPLFVKTVFVNGSRHAILFEKDPLLHCVNSPSKRISRPNSSLSFASGLSISSSEDSQNTNSECKSFKLKTRGKGKDLSSELQSCLVKFKLASSGLKNRTKSSEEKCFCGLKAKCKEKENPKSTTQKENHDKSVKRCEQFFEEQNEYKVTERNSSNKSCYIYNLENYKRRKNYSFVKITSQSPQFILNCTCENDWNENHNSNPHHKNNLVISASIKNLVMAPDEKEKLLGKTLDYVLPFENSDLNWNNYLTKSYYNSLAERVFQWLDLVRKRKKAPEKLNSTDDVDSGTSVERIYSGKTFTEEIKKNDNLGRTNKNSNIKKNGKLLQSDNSEEEIEEKVIREVNVVTLLSLEKNDSSECLEKVNSAMSEAVEDEKRQLDNFLINPVASEDSTLNIIKTPLKIQNLFVNSPSEEINSFRNQVKRKLKDPRSVSSHQNKNKETHCIEDEKNFSITERGNKGIFTEKPEKHPKCHCSKNSDTYGDDINSQILTEEFAERNQKSINNLNITRTRPALIQNLSPQQHDKISSSEEEKIVWASEKSKGRPQLHIFMPSVLLKDQSDDSMSECETFLNL